MHIQASTAREPQGEHPHPHPHPSWPGFGSPAPAALLAIAIVLLTVSFLISLLRQVLVRRVSQRRGWLFTTIYPPSLPSLSSYDDSSKRSNSKTRNKNNNINNVLPVSEIGTEACRQQQQQRRQLLVQQPVLSVRHHLLANTNARGSLYDTFQVPAAPHASRLKFSRSMMELNGGSSLEAADEKGGVKKAKTIHWHGINRLNTAWAWMS